MIVELRQKSQITIPTELTKSLSLKTGDKFDVLVKNGTIVLVPVTVYPKAYVDYLEKEVYSLKMQISKGDKKVFHNLDDMKKSLEKE